MTLNEEYIYTPKANKMSSKGSQPFMSNDLN